MIVDVDIDFKKALFCNISFYDFYSFIPENLCKFASI